MPTLWPLQLLFTAFFSVAAIMKLCRHPHMVDEFRKFGYPYGLARFAGLCEIIAVACLLLGWWLPLATALGAGLLAAMMVGAAYVNFSKRPARYGWGTLVIAALCLWLAAATRQPWLDLLAAQ